jgi:hypothetical protein
LLRFLFLSFALFALPCLLGLQRYWLMPSLARWV